MENPASPYFKLNLAEENVAVTFHKDLLKYLVNFKNAYDEGYREGVQDPDFQLEWPLWLFVRQVLKEHEEVHGEEDGPQTMINLPYSDNVTLITLSDLYRMFRVFNFYDAPLVVQFLTTVIIGRLLKLDRSALMLANPQVEYKTFMAVPDTLTQPLEVVNSGYAVRYATIIEVLKKYVGTQDLINLIRERFLPTITSVLSSGYTHIMVVTEKGLMGRGENNNGELGLGTNLVGSNRAWFSVPTKGVVISAWCASDYSMVLTTEGLYASGSNESGKLGLGPALKDHIMYALTRVDLPQVLSVGCGIRHTLFLTSQGVYATGENRYGQLGLGVTTQASTPKVIELAQHIVSVACGAQFSLLLSAEGEVYSCGLIYEMPSDSVPTLLPLPKEAGKIVSMVCGEFYGILVDERGDVYVFGDNSAGQLGLGHREKVKGIVKQPHLKWIISVSTSAMRTLFIDKYGNLYVVNASFDPTIEPTLPVKQDVRNVILATTNDVLLDFITCDGLYTLTEMMGDMKEPITLTNKAICKPKVINERDTDDTDDSLKKARFRCHFCGNHTDLVLHHQSQRIFCSKSSCLSVFRRFRVP